MISSIAQPLNKILGLNRTDVVPALTHEGPHEVVNGAITVEQIRTAFDDEVIGDLALYAGGEPEEVAWQLTAALPDLVDAFSPGGVLVNTAELRGEFLGASDAGDRSAGPVAPHID